MPSFGFLSSAEKEALVNFLFGLTTPEHAPPAKKAMKEKVEADVPYTHTGYNRFFDPEGYPAVKPPWGTLNAINLNEGTIEWKAVLGEIPELIRRGIPPTGTENYGGPVVTDGGLLFIGATKDQKFRAFDKKTGSLLWETTLPAGGYATPATYMVNGKQFVVIAAGGGKMGTPSGDAYVAFALPEE
jgi:quinoprotein glucose dehydrogenase